MRKMGSLTWTSCPGTGYLAAACGELRMFTKKDTRCDGASHIIILLLAHEPEKSSTFEKGWLFSMPAACVRGHLAVDIGIYGTHWGRRTVPKTAAPFGTFVDSIVLGHQPRDCSGRRLSLARCNAETS